MIVTNIKNCRSYENCEKCPNTDISKCMEACPTGAIKLLDGKAFSCITCGTCEKECPTGAIKKNEYGGYYVNRKKCTGCGICKNVCPINIIEIKETENKKSYPDGICVMCGLCTTACPYDARIYFDPSKLKNSKNKMLMERYSAIFKLMGKTYEFKVPKTDVTIKNPAERTIRKSININHNECNECGKCIYLCPKNTIIEGKMVDACTRCNLCSDACPVNAIEFGKVNENCVLCGNCILKCPKDVLKIENFKISKTKEEMAIKPVKHCINCGLCVDKCPTGALRFNAGKILYDPNTCILCNLCVKECPKKS
jgi:energy-converting hydrogenase B subunit K